MRPRLVVRLIPFVLSLAILGVAFGQEKEEEPKRKIEIPKLEDSTNLDVPGGLSDEVVKLYEKAKASYDEAYRRSRDPALKGGADYMAKAIKDLQKVHRKDKKFHLPCYYLGIAYQFTRDFKDAERYMRKALDLHPDFHEAMLELGDIYFWKRDWSRAIEWYDKALALRPDYYKCYEQRMVAHCRIRDFKKALVDAEHMEALEEDEERKKAYGRLKEMLQKEAEGYDFDPKYEVESEHYIVISNHSQEAAEEISEEVEKAFRLYTSRFPKMDKGAEKFPVIIFKDRDDYMAYGAPPGSAGYYSPFVRKFVLFYEGGGRFKKVDVLMVLRHEAFHQYLHFYLESAPQWFNEGQAEFFGATVDAEEKVGGKLVKGLKPVPHWWRTDHIKAAVQDDAHMPLNDFMTMTREQMYDRTRMGVNYAQAWSIIYFCWMYPKDLQGKYFPVLNKYFTALRDGKGLHDAYDASFGKIDMEKFEKEWKTFTLGLVSRKPRD